MTHQLHLGDLVGEEPVARAAPAESSGTITVRGDEVVAVSPEGATASMKLVELLERARPARIDTRGTVLPDGVKCAIPVPGGNVLVHQTPPRVHRFRWISPDSPRPFGEGTSYREVRLALPYLVVLAVFDDDRQGIPRLGNRSECFFSSRPLDVDGIETPLHFPALLNCSRFPDEDPERPLSWICVQHLPDQERLGGSSASASVKKGLDALLRHLLESGFNLSSEHHEVSSWYSETVRAEVDPRLATVEDWERATAEDPLFVLEVAWLPTGRTLAQVAERIASARGGRTPGLESAGDVMRILFRPRGRERRRR